ncbi:MAG: type II toxin-antitoxin system VapC family toxin [Burkholderiaceae bacterium]|nr:type II toxin-antitoxin system VapC family toxin [Burkholderiaceae bacterium]
MRILLDTQVLLWAMADPSRLPLASRRLLSSGTSEVCFSLASIWEIAIKYSLGKLTFDADVIAGAAQADGFGCLDIRREHLSEVQRLPWHHRDPFDRLLVAQSIVEPAVLLTSDAVLPRYGPTIRSI